MKTRSEETRRRLDWLLNLERRPRTLNGHYYSDYRDKFLAYYKGCRHSDTHGSLIHSLEGYRGPPNSMSMSLSGAKADSSVPDFNTSVAKVLSGLQEIGISSKAMDLPNLLPSDPMEPALHVMATVRAYFQGTSKYRLILSFTF